MSLAPPALAGVSLFLTVAAAHALAVVSPGPDFAIVVRQSLARGHRAGILTALGIAAGIAVHLGYALFGLAYVIQQWPSALTVLHVGGALILLWIGSQAVRAQPAAPGPAPDAAADGAPSPPRRGSDFTIGLLTNVLNVKAMLFFVALCSTVIGPQVPTPMRLALGGWMVFATGAWFCFLAVTLGHPRVRLRLARSAHWIDRGMGVVLLVLGAAILESALF